MSLGLYIHIPFCNSRCPYCDFAFVVRKNHLAERYTNAVITELQNQINSFETPPIFNTVYFGGGTPSAIPPATLLRILQNVQCAPNAEITVEANPNDQMHFEALYKHGINRLSLGVQAFTDRALKALGRFHNTTDAIDAFNTARKVGFKNIGIDLIFSAPEQTHEEWKNTLDKTTELNPEHISVYGLTIEPETNFARRFKKGQLHLPTETDQADMYMYAIDHLEAAGYEHYEISNFAQPGFASRHNLCYWQEQPYWGVGLSAHSYLNNRRAWNVRDLITYMERIETTGSALEEEETITPSDHLLERLMLGLRQRRGVDANVLNNHKIREQYTRLSDRHLLQQIDNRICLTRRGLLLADLVCTELAKGL